MFVNFILSTIRVKQGDVFQLSVKVLGYNTGLTNKSSLDFNDGLL